jgi:hypothetical protein
VFRSFLALSLVRGTGDTPVRRGSWILGCERDSIDRSCTVLVNDPSMPPGPTAPRSLAGLLAEFRPCFTAPRFQTFIGPVVGLIAQARRRTVCGMLTGAGLDQVWHHSIVRRQRLPERVTPKGRQLIWGCRAA